MPAIAADAVAASRKCVFKTGSDPVMLISSFSGSDKPRMAINLSNADIKNP